MNDQRIQHGIFYGLVAIVVVGAIAVVVLNLQTSDSAVTVSDSATTTPVSDIMAVSRATMTFEFATTTEAQEKGLGGRAVIPDNYALVFMFSKADKYGFWMKDMLQPIDIIWLSDSGRVLGIVPSLATSSYPNPYYPPQPVRYVLETRAGFMAAHDISVGDPFPDLSLPKE